MDIAACLRADASALSIALLQFVNEFQAGILQLILRLPSGTGVFAPTCLVHCLSGQTSFHTLTAAGTTLAASLTSWYFNQEGVMAVSPCIGWDCINACGVDLQNSLPCNIGSPQCSALTLASEAGATTSTDESGATDAGEVPQLMAQVLALRPSAAGGAPAPPYRAPVGVFSRIGSSGAPPSMARASAGKSAASSLQEKHTSEMVYGGGLLALAAAVAAWLVLRGRRDASRSAHRYHPIGEPDGLPMRRVAVR